LIAIDLQKKICEWLNRTWLAATTDGREDTLSGGNGADFLTGGAGIDFFSGGSGQSVTTDFNAGEGDARDGTVESWAPAVIVGAAENGGGEAAATPEPSATEEEGEAISWLDAQHYNF
jgi:hypothetical protein